MAGCQGHGGAFRLSASSIVCAARLGVSSPLRTSRSRPGTGAVGLVGGDDVGQLEEALLDPLEGVAGASDREPQERVRHGGDGHLGLPDAHGLHQHDRRCPRPPSARSSRAWQHPATVMLDAVNSYLDTGGRLTYMGANGFHWVINYDPENQNVIEVSKGHGSQAWRARAGEYHLSFTGEYGIIWHTPGNSDRRQHRRSSSDIPALTA
jgi:hypothetical protein